MTIFVFGFSEVVAADNPDILIEADDLIRRIKFSRAALPTRVATVDSPISLLPASLPIVFTRIPTEDSKQILLT
jgi:hypothetical protein